MIARRIIVGVYLLSILLASIFGATWRLYLPPTASGSAPIANVRSNILQPPSRADGLKAVKAEADVRYLPSDAKKAYRWKLLWPRLLMLDVQLTLLAAGGLLITRSSDARALRTRRGTA